MKLYKNVDIADLESILEYGVLSLNESGNNNWDERKRANNSCDVVYMFKPIKTENSFTHYGAALLEIDIPDEQISQNELSEADVNHGKYLEYVADRVDPEMIKKIYIPKIFRSKINLSNNVLKRITWCKMEASYYCKNEKEKRLQNNADAVIKIYTHQSTWQSKN